ncbi:RNA 2',3'-cyclic phosphodiesterase [Methylocystis sp. IM3]|uniref:RNA 2',3'-cyclic phosphodiesterase n=1 Tax=Methylocystis sp. IM3 TaxID=3136722 RepID=UPI00311A8B99
MPGNDRDDASASGPPQGMRVFLGVKVAPNISDQLACLAKELREERVKFVAPGDIHLTLVPPWNETSIDEAIAKMRSIVSKFGEFALGLKHLNYGPEAKRPRLLWAECAAPDELNALRDALLHLFDQSDDRPFRPHVTLARLRGNGAAIARRHPIDRALSFTQQVKSVEFFRSPPAGATGYQILASAPLAERAPPASGVEASPPDVEQ